MSPPKKIQIRNSTAEFLVFTAQAGENGIEVRVEGETVWLTQKLIAALFAVDVRTVSEHLQNIFTSGELTEAAVIRKFRNTATDGKSYLTAHYNLDASGGRRPAPSSRHDAGTPHRPHPAPGLTPTLRPAIRRSPNRQLDACLTGNWTLR